MARVSNTAKPSLDRNGYVIGKGLNLLVIVKPKFIIETFSFPLVEGLIEMISSNSGREGTPIEAHYIKWERPL